MQSEKQSPLGPESLEELGKAFNFFNDQTARLESAYKQLEEQVSQLNSALEAKNIQLTQNLEEKDTLARHLENILHCMNMGVIEIDLNGRIVRINITACEILGYNSEALMGRRYEDVFQVGEMEENTPLRALREKQEYKNIERPIRTAAGTMIPVESNVSLISGAEGQLIGAVELFLDLRQIKSLEEQVQQQRTFAALGEMAANVAHEIRNPLGGIGGFAALLERDLEPGDSRRNLVRKIIDGVSSLNRIAANLLFFTRPIQPKLRPSDLTGVLEDVLGLVEMELKNDQQPISVIREFDDTPVMVQLDPDLFQQVLINLCRNATQSIDGTGEVRVAIDTGARDRVELAVRDTGKGMTDDTIQKIFNPFFTTKADGSGLGMAIVKKIIDIHNGHIHVESTVGQGTTFFITLMPAAAE